MIHTNNGREFWLQVVPDGPKIVGIISTRNRNILRCHFAPTSPNWEKGIDDYLPLGTYRIHSDSATITEEQAAELVEVVDVYGQSAYKDYQHLCPYRTAVGSFESLLRSLKINNRVIILEKL